MNLKVQSWKDHTTMFHSNLVAERLGGGRHRSLSRRNKENAPMTSVARSSGDISCKATVVYVTCWGSDYVSFDICRHFFWWERGIFGRPGCELIDLVVEDSWVGIFFLERCRHNTPFLLPRKVSSLFKILVVQWSWTQSLLILRSNRTL